MSCFHLLVLKHITSQVTIEAFNFHHHGLKFVFSVDGGFDLWSAWTTCSETCGTGTQSRSRTCTNPVPANLGQNCTGDFDQAKSCKLTSCPGKGDKTT